MCCPRTAVSHSILSFRYRYLLRLPDGKAAAKGLELTKPGGSLVLVSPFVRMIVLLACLFLYAHVSRLFNNAHASRSAGDVRRQPVRGPTHAFDGHRL